MKFGVMPPYGLAPVPDGTFAAGFARAAEEAGFESLWLVEHVVMAVEYTSTYPYDPSGRSPFTADVAQPDPLVWLGYVAAATTRIRLATSVIILPQRNPLILAKEAATLDRLSGGRLELGIGVGWVREEAEALGTDFRTRGRRTDEYVAAMRALWREPVASFAGTFVNFGGVVSEPKPLQPGGVPIVVGGHSAAAARRAGRLGDGFFPLVGDPGQLGELRRIVRETADAHGRDPQSIVLTLMGGPDLASAEYCARSGAARMVISLKERTLDDCRRALERFGSEVIGRV